MCAHSQNGYLQIWFIQHSINTKFLATSSSQFSVTDDMNENTHPGSGGKTHHRHPVGFYCQLQETQLPLHCTVISGHAFTTEQCFYKITSAFSCFFPMHNYLRFTSVTEETGRLFTTNTSKYHLEKTIAHHELEASKQGCPFVVMAKIIHFGRVMLRIF